MKKHSCISIITILILTLSLFIFTSNAFAQEDYISSMSDGGASISNNNIANARADAITNALKKAVSSALETLMSSTNIFQSYDIIEDEIVNKSDQYIKNYKVVSEKAIGNIYQVTIKTVVLKRKLKKDLSDLGLLSTNTMDDSSNVLTTIEMSISGISSYLNFMNFQKKILNEAKGIQKISQLGFSAGKAKLEIEMRGTAQTLADELTMIMYEGFLIDITETTGDKINIKMRTK